MISDILQYILKLIIWFCNTLDVYTPSATENTLHSTLAVICNTFITCNMFLGVFYDTSCTKLLQSAPLKMSAMFIFCRFHGQHRVR